MFRSTDCATTPQMHESQNILLFSVHVNVENYLVTLFGRRKIIRIDLKETKNIEELNEIVDKRKGYLFSFINEPVKLCHVAYIFENADQCSSRFSRPCDTVQDLLMALEGEKKAQIISPTFCTEKLLNYIKFSSFSFEVGDQCFDSILF